MYGLPPLHVYNVLRTHTRTPYYVTHFTLILHNTPIFPSAPHTHTTPHTAIDRGATVVLDTKLTSSGHILFVYGYDTGDDGTHTDIILNDPYGNAYDRNTYGTLLNGQEVTYTWDMVYATDRWMVEVSV